MGQGHIDIFGPEAGHPGLGVFPGIGQEQLDSRRFRQVLEVFLIGFQLSFRKGWPDEEVCRQESSIIDHHGLPKNHIAKKGLALSPEEGYFIGTVIQYLKDEALHFI